MTFSRSRISPFSRSILLLFMSEIYPTSVLWGILFYMSCGVYWGMCAVGELLKKLKTSVAIDRDLIAWVDKMIAKKKYASRTHAIEYALQQLRENEGE